MKLAALLLLCAPFLVPVWILVDSKNRLGRRSWGWALFAGVSLFAMTGQLGRELQGVTVVNSAAEGRVWGAVTAAYFGMYFLYRVSTRKKTAASKTVADEKEVALAIEAKNQWLSEHGDLVRRAGSLGFDVVPELAGYAVRKEGRQAKFCYRENDLEAYLGDLVHSDGAVDARADSTTSHDEGSRVERTRSASVRAPHRGPAGETNIEERDRVAEGRVVRKEVRLLGPGTKRALQDERDGKKRSISRCESVRSVLSFMGILVLVPFIVAWLNDEPVQNYAVMLFVIVIAIGLPIWKLTLRMRRLGEEVSEINKKVANMDE